MIIAGAFLFWQPSIRHMRGPERHVLRLKTKDLAEFLLFHIVFIVFAIAILSVVSC